MNKPASELIALADERAVLMAKNAAATSWGAAVGARSERIKEIDGLLAANQSGSERAGVDALREALKPFAKMAGAMYVSGHCGGASPEDWPDRWHVTVQGGKHFHTPQQHGGYLTVADFRRAAEALATPPAQPAPAEDYPHGLTSSDHIAHDLKQGRFPKRSTVEQFLSERSFLSDHGKPDGAVRPLRDNAAFQNTDGADASMVLAAVRHCASSWEGEARLLGNVRAKDIVRAIDALVRPDETEALRLLAAEDERQSKLHDLLETIREQIRLEVPVEHRPAGLFKNIQDAVYTMRGRTPLMNDAAVTAALHSPKIAAAETSPGDVLDVLRSIRAMCDEPLSYGRSNLADRIAAAIDRIDVKAEAKSQEPEAVAVKPLEWYEEPLRSPDQPAWNADSPVGAYRVFKAWWGKENKDGWIGNGEFHHTEAAAKAAAQADYEERVRSALIRPTTKPEAPAISLNGVTQVVYDHGPSFSWDECKKIAGSLLARFHITDRDARS